MYSVGGDINNIGLRMQIQIIALATSQNTDKWKNQRIA